MTITQSRPQPSPAVTPPSPSSGLPDPDFLERVARVSFQKLVLAHGELLFPCWADRIDDKVARLQALMLALGQRPPEAVLAQWRDVLLEKTVAGAAASAQAMLRVGFQPAEPLLGLVGGFQVGMTALVDETVARQAAQTEGDRPSSPAFDQCESLLSQTLVRGTLKMAALPSLIDQHLEQLQRLLEALGQTVTTEEVEGWRGAIAPHLHQLFHQSPNAYLVVRYRVLDPTHGLASGLALEISGELTSIEAEYQSWTHTRQGPLFGAHADAKVLDVATQVAGPILDIGAGTGRNSLALARLGYVVDALELAPALAAQLIQAKVQANLNLTVIEGDILDPQLELPHRQYPFIFLSEVVASHFRTVEQVRQLFVRLSPLLAPGGILLFNAFVAIEGYHPTPAVRELAQAFWSCLFTPTEIEQATAGLPLQPLCDQSVTAYEAAHLPPSAWPPTDWFWGWATGRNLFPTVEQPPMELRWLAWQKQGATSPNRPD